MTRSILAALVSALLVACAYADYAFLSVGDWGGAQISAQDSANVYAVAAQMATTSVSSAANFIIGTGDNFYWCGIQNTTDPQIAVDFEKPYADAALQLPWYHALGVSLPCFVVISLHRS
jgi:hypothetical protein